MASGYQGLGGNVMTKQERSPVEEATGAMQPQRGYESPSVTQVGNLSQVVEKSGPVEDFDETEPTSEG